MDDMIKWGIIDAGNIAHRFAYSLENIEGATLYAVANRTIEKAEAFKAEHPCEMAYGSYDALLADENIDVVYIALPHKYHLEWTKKTFDAGKAVLCEKPATLSLDEMKQISESAKEKNLFFMEAMKNRFTPAYIEVRNLVEAGKIGDVIGVYTSLCRVFPVQDTGYFYEPVQGGCLLDMGVYNASFIEDFISEPFELNELEYDMHEETVEVYVNAHLTSGNVEVILESAFDRETETKAIIRGTKGMITVSDFHRPISYILQTEETMKSVEVPYRVDDFYGEIRHVVDCLVNGLTESPIMTLENSENIAGLLDVIKSEIPLKD